jgi:hypothetical protein
VHRVGRSGQHQPFALREITANLGRLDGPPEPAVAPRET